jgi:ParB family chromosome partitioning protein
MGKLDAILAATGRNLDESIGAGREAQPLHGATPRPTTAPANRLTGISRSQSAAEIPVDRIERDHGQPREEFDSEALERLAESLRTRGQLQPIRVRWEESRGVYVILCGERRWRAAMMAGLRSLSCVIHDGSLTETERLEIQLVENALREDLRPVEQAKAYKSLLDSRGWSTRQLAAELALHPGSISRALALLDLPSAVQHYVEVGELPPATAYEITKIDDPDQQETIAATAVSEGLSRSEVAEFVQAVKARRRAPASRPDPVTVDVGDGLSVTVRWRKANGISLTQALKKALKLAQASERAEEAA